MDITASTEPKSDQQNFDDYIGGEKTVTITELKSGSAEQPVEIHLREFPGRPFKPSKSMRRVLIACWGAESADYTGRRMTLYGDPTVKFGGQSVGGIRISALSHIDKPVSINLTVSRGKRAPFTVQPLPDSRETANAHITALTNAATLDQLSAAWHAAVTAGVAAQPDVTAAKDARKTELNKEEN